MAKIDLNHADLWGADLQGANLEEANLLDADLQGAHLDNANLLGTDYLTQEQLDVADGNDQTKLPAIYLNYQKQLDAADGNDLFKPLTRPAHWKQKVPTVGPSLKHTARRRSFWDWFFGK